MDVGQPKDYLRGNHLYLESVRNNQPDILARSEQYQGVTVRGNVLIVTCAACGLWLVSEPFRQHSTARIEAGCDIGPDVVIGRDCRVGAGVRLERCACGKTRRPPSR